MGQGSFWAIVDQGGQFHRDKGMDCDVKDVWKCVLLVSSVPRVHHVYFCVLVGPMRPPLVLVFHVCCL